jgi:hypothetical protein
MKIIKKTNTDAWAYNHTCDICDSELEVEKSDLYTQHFSADTFRNEPAYDKFYFYCPVCRAKIDLLTDDVPKAVRIEVKQKRDSNSMNPSGGDFRDGPFEDFYNK